MKPAINLEITSRTVAFGGAYFGDGGQYERLVGVAHMSIDPGLPENRSIVDLDLAPRDASGLVNYDVDFEILRPLQPASAAPVLVYEVVNRGLKVHLGGEPKQGHVSAFLLNRGYTIMWSGWQGYLPAGPILGARLPVATSKGQPITGRIEAEAIFDDFSSDRLSLPYPANSLDQKAGTLTVRARADSTARTIPKTDWRYVDDRHLHLKRPANMDAGAIYRFSYVAKDPRVMGLGFASVRDLVSFVRHASTSEGNPLADIRPPPCEQGAAASCPDPSGGAFTTAVAIGVSQSGRFLRDYTWQGFNRDSAGNRVFDGMLAVVAGGRRTFTNLRFSDPGRFSRQHEDHETPGFSFPFAYGSMKSPVTGKSDGILEQCSRDGSCPKVFHIDSSTEFWQAGSSLVGTDATGRDLVFPENVRAFLIASTSHAPGIAAPGCQLAANPLTYSPVVRALTISMVEWTLDGTPPPDSEWPQASKDELRPLKALNPPSLSGIGLDWPKAANRPQSQGASRDWPVLLPRVDADGNDVAGLRLPQIDAPLGTYLGWNPRKAGYAPRELCSAFGGFVPFATIKQSDSADPRPALEERYGEKSRAVVMQSAIAALVDKRLLLKEDVQSILAEN